MKGDRLTEGLALLIVQQVGELTARIAKAGVAILLVEQKLSIAMKISNRVYIMGHGRVVFEGTPTSSRAMRPFARNGSRCRRAPADRQSNRTPA
ncbi:ABC-type branched-subunit amino acid transport system ATPase component [Bradyrhizobium elkanii]|nr:ABC-type branched-subunit amino acid transport system ATPase component [Bradyrhizobium elkanii]MCS3564930.1 ABC-type branched-subunit amino acid transport system ATPase component [Bradyrhizobium elkanii]MCW2145240.1 ABC-type branched-subunit amino acid transport system ATPase component [Bradyrhizobium elkanii]MCW2355942.1 ABC-type branched-subunit amino acid transport system ATPase component [Bradyrhizobium elkanii]MCW2378067.1 ABC-type branched-subunit amino acid transport system ATPase com